MSGALILFACAGASLKLPAQASLLADRADGGNLQVLPPRPVWDRSALSVAELTAWSHLVAAAAEAMLTALPQLDGGCINYWDAGNWALNDEAEPKGPKTARRTESCTCISWDAAGSAPIQIIDGASRRGFRPMQSAFHGQRRWRSSMRTSAWLS